LRIQKSEYRIRICFSINMGNPKVIADDGGLGGVVFPAEFFGIRLVTSGKQKGKTKKSSKSHEIKGFQWKKKYFGSKIKVSENNRELKEDFVEEIPARMKVRPHCHFFDVGL